MLGAEQTRGGRSGKLAGAKSQGAEGLGFFHKHSGKVLAGRSDLIEVVKDYSGSSAISSRGLIWLLLPLPFT